jgi:hypothetical protein
MREVKMKSLDASPRGIRHPGKKYHIPKEEAAALVKGGFAEYATIQPPADTVIKPPEKETIEAPERASEEENGKIKKGGRKK